VLIQKNWATRYDPSVRPGKANAKGGSAATQRANTP